MDIKKDVSYKAIRNLSKYLESKGIRKKAKIRKYNKVMKIFNNQKNFMKDIRKEFSLAKTPSGFNKKDLLDRFVFSKIIRNEDFKYDEIRLLWD